MTVNYHNEEVTFAIGQTVTDVADEGAAFAATIIAMEGDQITLRFEDGDEGIEIAASCFS